MTHCNLGQHSEMLASFKSTAQSVENGQAKNIDILYNASCVSRVIWWKSTGVSEELTATVIRVEAYSVCLVYLLFRPGDGGNIFIRNEGNFYSTTRRYIPEESKVSFYT